MCSVSEMESDYSSLIKPLSISLERVDFNNKKNLGLYIILKENSSKTEISHEPPKCFQYNEVIQQYLCSHPGCDKLFGKHSRLIVHERTHTGERPFKCNYENCSKSYTRKFHLTRHIIVSHTSLQEPKDVFRCEKCSKDFSNCYSLKKHETHFHNNEERYSCKDCGHIFRKQQHLKTHSYVHTGIKPYKCNFLGCESRYSIPSRLKRHSLTHVSGRYHCTYDECSAKLDSYTDLVHHLSDDHKKICNLCGKEFDMMCRLRAHISTHQEMREAFFCPFTPCERYYFEEKNLHSHICSKHNKAFKGFECPICSKWIVTKQKLKYHLTTHDLDKPDMKREPIKPRKPRKDKGISRTDFAKLLSGYSSDSDTQDSVSRAIQPSCSDSN